MINGNTLNLQPLGQRLGVRGYGTGKHEGRLQRLIFQWCFWTQIPCCVLLLKVGLKNRDCLTCVYFLYEGSGSYYHKHPMYKLPIVGGMFFLNQNQKMVVGSINFSLCLGRNIEVNKLSLKRHCWFLLIHVRIKL
jgi:hypothetical protein